MDGGTTFARPGGFDPRRAIFMSIDRRVLIADDDRELRACVADLLGDMHLEIVHAESGTEALHIVRGSAFHLALLDMHMPGQTGLEVLSVIRREVPGLPCIFFSGDATDGVRRLALAEGALAVLAKPLVPSLLRSEVARALAFDGRRRF